jgi:hypothetical protein
LRTSEASEVGAVRRTSGACAEQSVCGAEQRVESKGDKEGEKVDAIASGMGRG